MNLVIKIIIVILTYLLGSIPFGVVIAKAKGIDIRQHGSKNIGSTNVGRIIGKKYGVLTFCLDALKGGLVVALFRYQIIPKEYCIISPLLYGLVAVLGHTFSIYIKFSGGKAVATSAGVILAFSPFTFIIMTPVFLIVLLSTRYMSLASLTSAFFTLVISILLYFFHFDILVPNLPYDYWYPIFTFIMFAIITIRHSTNIERLLKKKETKLNL